jgi:hypothetical protein
MIEKNKTLYMVIHTHERVLEEPSEFFEDLPIYPESILEEKDKPVQESLILKETLFEVRNILVT